MPRPPTIMRRFLSDERGSVIVFIGFAILMLVVAGGVAIDVARGQAVQSKLHAALDAAGLAAGKVATNDLANNIDPSTDPNISAVANTYFMANFPSGYLGTAPYGGTPPISATYQSSTGTIAMTVNANGITQSTSIIRIAGISSVNISDASTIKVVNATNGSCGTSPGACAHAQSQPVTSFPDPSGSGAYDQTWTCPSLAGGQSAACSYTPPTCSNPLVADTCASPSTVESGTYNATSGQWQCQSTTTQTVDSTTTSPIPNFTPVYTTCTLAAINGTCTTATSTVGCNSNVQPANDSGAGTNPRTWQCPGSFGGTTANCEFTDGVCGATYDICNPGTPVSESAANQDWICNGSSAGGTAVIGGTTYTTTPGLPSDSALNTFSTTAGKDCLGTATAQCGSLASASGASTAGACGSGSTYVSGPTTPDQNGNYSWVCALTNDSSVTATCNAYNGVCPNPTSLPTGISGTSGTGACQSTPGTAPATESAGVWNWTCPGSSDGGVSSALCTFTGGGGGGGSSCAVANCNGKALVYVADSGNNRVAVFATDGTYCGQMTGGTTPLNSPQQLSFDATGKYIYVLDVNPSNSNDTRITKFSTSACSNDPPTITPTSIAGLGGCSLALNTTNGGIQQDGTGVIFIATYQSGNEYVTSCGAGIMTLFDNGNSVSYSNIYGSPGTCFNNDGCQNLNGVTKFTLQNSGNPITGDTAVVIQQGLPYIGGPYATLLPGISYEKNVNTIPTEVGEGYSAPSDKKNSSNFAISSIAQDPSTNNWWIVYGTNGDPNFTNLLRITSNPSSGFNTYEPNGFSYNKYNGDHYINYEGTAAYGAAFDTGSNLYLTDYNNNQVVVLSNVDMHYYGAANASASATNAQPVNQTFGASQLNGPVGIIVQPSSSIPGGCYYCPLQTSPGTTCFAGYQCSPGYNPAPSPYYTVNSSTNTISWTCYGLYGGGANICSQATPIFGECGTISADGTTATCGTDPGYSGIQPDPGGADYTYDTSGDNNSGELSGYICHGYNGGDVQCKGVANSGGSHCPHGC